MIMMPFLAIVQQQLHPFPNSLGCSEFKSCVRGKCPCSRIPRSLQILISDNGGIVVSIHVVQNRMRVGQRGYTRSKTAHSCFVVNVHVELQSSSAVESSVEFEHFGWNGRKWVVMHSIVQKGSFVFRPNVPQPGRKLLLPAIREGFVRVSNGDVEIVPKGRMDIIVVAGEGSSDVLVDVGRHGDGNSREEAEACVRKSRWCQIKCALIGWEEVIFELLLRNITLLDFESIQIIRWSCLLLLFPLHVDFGFRWLCRTKPAAIASFTIPMYLNAVIVGRGISALSIAIVR
mmetsp:Transcript_21134/g.44834  ORF Transcript_21134/g.44834 Transcript_21134/m.44834 type:complete len:288 (-) Transcript_21134:357-1220(-)